MGKTIEIESDILTLIPFDQLDSLKAVYRYKWPKYCHVYYYIELAQEWKRKYSYKIEFYAPNGDFTDGSFVVVPYEEGKMPNFSFFSLDPASNSLLEALRKTNLLQWSNESYMELLHKNQMITALDALALRGCMAQQILLGILWWISSEEAKNFDITCPANMELRPLEESHVDEIYDCYPHKDAYSKKHFLRLIKRSVTIGLFEKDTNTLASWIMRNDFGILGILQTKTEYLRKGYGELVTKALSRKMAELDIDPCASTIVSNIRGQNMFKKLGFKPIDYTCWLQIKSIL